jgi:phosphate transport system substrate-binding protein
MNIKIRLAILPLLFLFSCSDNKPSEELDTPVRGKIRISIDENIQPLTDELIDAFESSYPDAFLLQSYGPEKNVLQELFDDSSRLAVMTRQLTAEERKYFEAKTFGIEEIRIGMEAVVLLVNRANPDSIFTVDQVRKILSGEISDWSQLRPGSALGAIRVVFDNKSSSNLRYLSDTLLNGGSPGKNCFALESNDSVVNYVNTTENSIGIIGLNWLGDRDRSDDRIRRSKVSLAMIGKDSASATHPHQSALVTGAYPFRRSIWIVKIGRRPGLGTGFATFSLGQRGQLIVQRAGLAPASPAERRIKLNTY